MPRAKKKAAKKKSAPRKPKAKPFDGFKVTHVPLQNPTLLVAVEPGDACWSKGKGIPHAKHGIVRVRPPPDATDQDIANIEAALRNGGAKTVRVLPREPAGRPSVHESAETKAARESKPARQVVLDMVEGATNSHDKKALATFVEDVMSEEGL